MALVVKSSPANAGDTRENGFDPWARKIPWRVGVTPRSSILAWRIPRDSVAWQATVHSVAKGQT